ncbi:MAG: ribonuclease HI family protein [Candidatus Hydrothermarchaeota archaeon]
MRFYIDGGVRSHQTPGKRRGFIAVVYGNKKVVEAVGGVTNNQAEYLALIRALELARGEADVEILSDSELLVRQMKGEYAVRNQNLVPLHRKAKELVRGFEHFTVQWVPRGENLAGKVLE